MSISGRLVRASRDATQNQVQPVPIKFTAKHLLLDIEGTTSSVSYVFEVLFPYVRERLKNFLEIQWEQKDVVRVCEQIAKDAGARSFQEWCGSVSEKPARIQKVIGEINRLMDGDVKATGLKELQGLIWRDGFIGGELRAHVYPDVPLALKRWKDAGFDIRIYSSGSIEAQKLFFAHTEAGDLLKFFNGHYDTTSGSKKTAESYRTIAANIDAAPRDILFASDIVAELDAAEQAGVQTVLVVRSGTVPPAHGGHAVIKSFDEIVLSAKS